MPTAMSFRTISTAHSSSKPPRARQNHRARQPHRPGDRNRPRRGERNRLRHVHREGRRRAEAQAPRRARRIAHQAAAGSTERERLDNALRRLEEAQISTIHGFCADLLRERPVEARVDPLFPSLPRRRPADCTARRFIPGFRSSCRIRLRACSGRFAAQASSGSAPQNEDGPVERLPNAGWELIQWRDFEGDWQRPPFDRQSRIDALVNGCATSRTCRQALPISTTALSGSRPARQLSEDIDRTEKVAPRD